MTTMKRWGHDELQSDLAAHLRSNTAVMAWENMQLGPQGSPRPDVYTIGKSFARFNPLAYEIKVSEADFRRDVTAGKWQSYLQFAGAVVFAAPAGLIKKSDLPAGCGLIQRHDSGWRMAKGPTLVHVDTLPRNAWLKMLIDGIDRQSELARIESRGEPRSWHMESKLRHRFGDDVARLISSALQSEESVRASIKAQELELKEIRQGTHKEIKSAIQHAKRESGYMDESLTKLAIALGCAPDSSSYEIIRALDGAARRIEADSEVMRLRNNFERIISISQDCIAAVPGLNADLEQLVNE